MFGCSDWLASPSMQKIHGLTRYRKISAVIYLLDGLLENDNFSHSDSFAVSETESIEYLGISWHFLANVKPSRILRTELHPPYHTMDVFWENRWGIGQ